MAFAVPLNDGDSSIAEARHLALDFLTRARTDLDVTVSARAMDLTQLVVSELVTNARKYAPGPMVMELRIVDSSVAVTVHDSARARPVARPEDPHRIGGHGLEIVKAVAQNFHVHLEPAGKRVTAHIPLAGEPAAGGRAASSVHSRRVGGPQE
ncbi:ATP-binding protein [Streptomyces sp. BA2]|uniref:ATP-binding protein n=1 Tax=Streptomyces sp. BA2 TaxID=436595 RepID=UPI001F2C3CA2|nr:ATP-binding protein [Streptomyces sp. BA2]